MLGDETVVFYLLTVIDVTIVSGTTVRGVGKWNFLESNSKCHYSFVRYILPLSYFILWIEVLRR